MQYYYIIKSVHIITVICWMAGLLYLPRLFVYHCTAIPNGELDITLRTMERRLLLYIMNPSMTLVLTTGFTLLWPLDWKEMWIHFKITMVLCMVITHCFLFIYQRLFFVGKNKKSSRFFRILNEVPTIIMITIVFSVILK